MEKLLADHFEKMNSRVVSSFGYTHGDLSEAFDEVKNEENWKYPIDTVIPKKSLPYKEDIYREAIVYFTGSVPTFTKIGEFVRIRADGYYNTIGV